MQYELEHLIDKDKFTGRAETEARIEQDAKKCNSILDISLADDNIDILDHKILDLAARSDEYTITPIDVFDHLFRFQWLVNPTYKGRATDNDVIQKMKRLAELGYLVGLEDVNERGVFTSFKINLELVK